MAKSSFQIRMNYHRAIQQADSLLEVASELQRNADSDFQDCISQISGSWTGDSAAAYLRKCDLLRERILLSAKQLRKTAEAIKQIAKRTYDAEMRALRIMQQREY